jgi:hypothetical protein
MKGALAAAGPLIFERRARAQFSYFGSAEHVLILYAGGGLRTPPLFYADVAEGLNPFGHEEGARAQWTPGAIARWPSVQLSTGEVLPSLVDIASDIAVIAGVDHDPQASIAPTTHADADLRLTSGMNDGGDSGLLSIIHRDHQGYRDKTLALPPFDLGRSSFARAGGAFAGFEPMMIGSAAELTGRSKGTIPSEHAAWAAPLRDQRDAALASERPPFASRMVGALRDARTGSRVFARVLADPALDLLGDPSALLGGITNAEMLEVLGGGASSKWGLEVALALRLLQLGSPAVTVFHYLYDFHAREKDGLPADGGDLLRQMAGVHFLLHRMTDARGIPLWSSTVAIVVSELGRDDTDPQTGFNSADGSDHRGTAASRNQIWPIFGGPIARSGACIGRLDPMTLAAIDRPASSVRSVHSTLLALLGIDPSAYWPDPPIDELFA